MHGCKSLVSCSESLVLREASLGTTVGDDITCQEVSTKGGVEKETCCPPGRLFEYFRGKQLHVWADHETRNRITMFLVNNASKNKV